ncbi:periplasmic heavy metal sensor [Sphingoaurantiacus capsulatus]|uniref:Periplasmic heavy metal sensor n=1 Tax=Sphingoaurantiacus capsulatus TaxID=1771310 RepID=A0ABV7XDA8_9SPHN
MIRSTLKVAAATLVLVVAAPLFAQTPPPAPGAPTKEMQIRRLSPGMQFHGDRFEGMSPEGRAILREAMKPQVTPQDREAVKAARKKVLGLIAADRLDVSAVRSAQAAERDLVVKQHERQQAAMLAAYQKLSAADRKAFAGGMRDREERMLDSLKKSRERMEEMEKRIRERMKERETGSVVLDDFLPMQPIAYTAGR